MARHPTKPKLEHGVLDAPVKLGPAAKELGETLTVSELLVELESNENREEQDHLRRARRNETYFHNLGQGEDDLTGVASGARAVFQDHSRNYYRNLVQTYSARFNQDRPSIAAYPTHPESTDVAGAEIANAVIEHQYSTQHFDKLSHELLDYAQLHSVAAVKCVWDPDGGEMITAPMVDEVTGEPLLDEEGNIEMENLGFEGEISWDLLTIFDYYYGGGNEIEDADWAVVTSYLNKYEARDLVYSYTKKWVDIEAVEFHPIAGKKEEGCKVSEIFYPPCPRIPKGLYAICVGGHCAYFSDYPYDHGRIPIVELKINPIRGTRHASSHADDAVCIQQRINELEDARVQITRAYGFPKLIGLEELVQQLDDSDQILSATDINHVNQGLRYLDPPALSPLVFEQQREYVEAMYDIFGLNEVLSGKDSVKSGTSAKQIAYLNSLDSQKMAGVARRFEVLLEQLIRLTLSTMRQYMSGERIVKIVGPEGAIQTKLFSAADLSQVDITLEPATGIERFRAQAAAEAEQDLQAGKIDPRAGMERAETGLGETMGDANQRGAAQQLVQQALSGQPVQPDPRIPPMVAIDVIDKYMQGAPPQVQSALQQLRTGYQKLMQPQPGAPQQGGGGAPQPRRPSAPRQQQQPAPGAPVGFRALPQV